MVLLGLAPDGVCPDASRHRDAGALLPHLFTFACTRLTCGRAIGRVVSVALSRGFRRVGITDRPCPVVSGLSSRYHPRDRMACAVKCRPDWRSGELGAAALTTTARRHLPGADRAGHGRAGGELSPDVEDRALERRPLGVEEPLCGCLRGAALDGGCGSLGCRHGAHRTLRNTPTTRPSTFASRVRIGLKSLFAGCSRTRSFSRKNRFTVASSSISATTISPLRADSACWTTT